MKLIKNTIFFVAFSVCGFTHAAIMICQGDTTSCRSKCSALGGTSSSGWGANGDITICNAAIRASRADVVGNANPNVPQPAAVACPGHSLCPTPISQSSSIAASKPIATVNKTTASNEAKNAVVKPSPELQATKAEIKGRCGEAAKVTGGGAMPADFMSKLCIAGKPVNVLATSSGFTWGCEGSGQTGTSVRCPAP